MERLLVSACLLGYNCKYSGRNNYTEEVEALEDRYELIPVCPEELGGLSIPRKPCEIIDGRVMTQDGEDKTEEFMLGATHTLAMAKTHKCSLAVLKENSPSCGSGIIYDGSFTGTKKKGMGLTASLLIENGIKVVGESQVNKN